MSSEERPTLRAPTTPSIVPPAMTPQQQQLTAAIDSPLAAYRRISVGDGSLPFFIWYEVVSTLFSNAPGMLGFAARALLYPSLLRQCSGRPAIGRGTSIRNSRSISLGKKVLIDDFVTLDAKGPGAAISLGNFVSIGKFSIITAKSGTLQIGDGCNIGTNCRIATQSKVEIGPSTLVAAYAYIGPGNHQPGDDEVPLIARDMEIKGGVRIGSHVWIGARATILDGVTIGDRAVVGAHSLVKENVPAGAIVAGTPAKIIGMSPNSAH